MNNTGVQTQVTTNLNRDEPEFDFCCEHPQIHVTTRGNYVCKTCGACHGAEYSQLERRSYTDVEYKNRRRTAHVNRSFGARTFFNSRLGDSNGKKFSAETHMQYFKLSRYNTSLLSSVERNFWEAMPFLQSVCSRLRLPNHVEKTAWLIYSECAKKRLTMGRSIQGFACASIHVSARIHDVPRVYEDIYAFATEEVTAKLMNKILSIVIKDVLPCLREKYGNKFAYRPKNLKEMINRFGNELKLHMITISLALKLLNDMEGKEEFKTAGKDPKGIAGSLLYIASVMNGEKRNQREMAAVCKVTEVTIRSRIRETKKILGLTIDLV